MGTVLTPKKFVASSAPCTTWLVASSGSVGMAARAAVYAAAATSCRLAAVALSALDFASQARYGACAAA
ncbi:hypothetical protein MYCO108962_12880 [Mycobacterium colombiense]